MSDCELLLWLNIVDRLFNHVDKMITAHISKARKTFFDPVIVVVYFAILQRSLTEVLSEGEPIFSEKGIFRGGSGMSLNDIIRRALLRPDYNVFGLHSLAQVQNMLKNCSPHTLWCQIVDDLRSADVFDVDRDWINNPEAVHSYREGNRSQFPAIATLARELTERTKRKLFLDFQKADTESGLYWHLGVGADMTSFHDWMITRTSIYGVLEGMKCMRIPR